MRRRNKYYKPRKSIWFNILRSFERWYYSLSFGIRHIVGVIILVAVFMGAFGITYGGYKLIVGGYCWVVKTWQGTWHFNDHDDEYSDSKHSHYDFPLKDSEKHPRRTPNYVKDFDHINDVHLVAATRLGIRPQQSRKDLEKMTSKLVELRDTHYYQILPLTSSSPYLVPRAADFLTALGKLMQEYNGTSSRFYISSVLRTLDDVHQLGKVNINASSNSTHCYGTTFDITYSRFDVHGSTTEAKLKEDIARALYDLQAKGYCYVKYEIKQPCFHVTVRP